MPVVPNWNKLAEDKLEQLLFPLQQPDEFESKRHQLNGILCKSFPGAQQMMVLDLYKGFRLRREEYILYVETGETDDKRGHVVKIAFEQTRLKDEHTAWKKCCNKQSRRDVVFMTLDLCHDEEDQIISLVYQDAQQWIGAKKTTSLEEAFHASVRSSNPSVSSLANVLFQLFHRLGIRLYSLATPHKPSRLVGSPRKGQPLDFRFNGNHWLGEALQAWSETPGAYTGRKEANSAIEERENALNSAQYTFLDPVLYLGDVLNEIRGGRPAAEFVPTMLRGRAHGDLHGRNVKVGWVVIGRDPGVESLTNFQVHWPALFDYEDMAKDNLLAWDFVKLETELKIRAYDYVFPSRLDASLPQQIWDFELELALRTEEYRLRPWPEPVNENDTPRNKLLSLILLIRRMAETYLSARHENSAYWLEDYYFALACYGVETARYGNQVWSELMGAYISAGTAASRFEYSRRSNHPPGDAGADVDDEHVSSILSGHLPPSAMKWIRFRKLRLVLALAYERARSGSKDDVKDALTLLNWLKGRYPKELKVRYERAFTLARLEETDQALDELAEIADKFKQLDVDTRSLWGRCWKDKGDAFLEKDELQPAAECYRLSFEKYDEAFAQSDEDRFPGINAAALRLVLAGVLAEQNSLENPGAPHPAEVQRLRAASRTIAEDLLGNKATWKRILSDDNIWIVATEAEAELLRGKCTAAKRLYRIACQQENVFPFHRRSMRTQVERILKAYERLGEDVCEPFGDLDDIFGPDNPD